MNQKLRFILQIFFLLGLSLGTGYAQSEAPTAQSLTASFETYECVFIPQENQVLISAALTAANGLPIPVSDVALTVNAVGEDVPVFVDSASIATVSQRPPLQMIIVLDTTETVPVEEIIAEMIDDFFPLLPVEDEVALITFSQEIQPRTLFYKDKIRLVNEHVLDLQVLEGDNQLYAAMLDATTSFQLESDARRVVLVLTDSGRRDDVTEIDAIIERAQLNDVQIFPIGFYTLDFPRANQQDFIDIANGTGGYSWFYDQTYISRVDVAESVGEFLTDFVVALNSEVSITVDMQEVDTGAANFVDLVLTLDTANDGVIETDVSCPIERLDHSITFIGDPGDAVVRGRFDVAVNAESDFPEEDTTILFLLNGEVAQDDGSATFAFNSSDYEPGYYTLTAELRDTRANLLARTPTSIRLFAQQSLGFRVLGDQNNLTGRVELIITAPDSIQSATQAEFTVAEATTPQDKQILGREFFDDNNIATLVIDDINTALERLFPDVQPNTQFVFGGRVQGLTINDPRFGVADDATINVGAAPVAPTPVPVAVPVAEPASLDFANLIWIALGLFMLVVNILLVRAVQRARIRKLIAQPDDYALSEPLMSITVYSNGLSQSHTLTKRTIFAGRGSTNDINLGSDSNISRNHGVIMWRKGNWYYSNRKPRLTALINDRKRRGLIFYRLKPFTEVMIGSSLMVFHANSQEDVADFVKTNI